MDVTLNLYKSRSEEILNASQADEKKIINYDVEYKNMIMFLECTIKKIKNDRAKFLELRRQNYSHDEYKIIQYDKETNQYFCDIDGIKLRGNIGQIYDRKILQNDKIKAHQVVPCNKKNACENILQQSYCKFYHDPVDLLVLKNAGIISEEFYKKTILLTRNFSTTSWLYSSKPNKYMRSFGSISNLENDLKLATFRKTKKDDIENFKAQIMHDILILRNIEKIEKIESNKKWENI